jgi:trypsin
MKDLKFIVLSILLGFSSAEPIRGKIVGGSNADSHQFPYQSAIRQINGRFVCNGFIINEFFIGTSAFCMMDQRANQIEALLGTTSLTTGGWIFRITQIILHNGFDASIHLNDVAVVRTNVPIRFSPIIRSIALGADFVQPGATVTISGYGMSSHLHNSVGANLNFIRKQVLTNFDCISRLNSNGQNGNLVFGNNFCTYNGVGQGICGNAGSPIVISDRVVGINSWDEFCGLGLPDIHTRVSNHRSWFMDNTQT